jgi:adenine-specific DNA-methyltransferase
VIKYIGSKRRLVPAIVGLARALPAVRTAVDLFAGTTRVAQGLKTAGLRVHANDTATYSEVLGRCYIETDGSAVDRRALARLLEELQELPATPGYFAETFCERSRYFHPKNGARIDAVRAEIDRRGLDRNARAVALTSLLEAADRVDSTTGLQMAYLKQWAPRALEDLRLRMPHLLAGPGSVTRANANRLVRRLPPIDLAYVDPPYNQHSFFRNYHVWETLVRNDRPEFYGVACKRMDCRTRSSSYNSPGRFAAALRDLLDHLGARYVLLSCSSEGYLDVPEVPGLLQRFGAVAALRVDSKRYVGAQIGIHNPKGEKVGRISHLRNHEYLFLAGPDAGAVRDALQGAAAALSGVPAELLVP